MAPTMVIFLLGNKWEPSIRLFQLLMAFTVVETVRINASSILLALNQPKQVAIVRFIQLLFLLISMFLLMPSFGVLGVAVSVNLMSVVGLLLIFYFVDQHLRVSRKAYTLVFPPLIDAVIAFFVARFLGINLCENSYQCGSFFATLTYILVFISGMVMYIYKFEVDLWKLGKIYFLNFLKRLGA